ncbi:uncharacterized protein LOC111266338 isoform X1 [Varroa jacobsoni]|uniref:uncharacterized protein LOC111266338 isoform X1 n=1 Tax=Varroa jacobsoni TaxID=62625 RepID=UPI000BF39E48|nr:uncharacterized protein LOC111266338 isoform X1 [Varroa jacobsoni]
MESFAAKKFMLGMTNKFKKCTYSVQRTEEYDLTIITSDAAQIRVQSSALCAQSEYFVGLLSSGMVEQQQRTVTFEDLDSLRIESFVQFCCTGELFICGKNFLHLLKLASRFISRNMLIMLQQYVRTDFLSIPQQDLSAIVTEPIDSETAILTREVLLGNMIPANMLDLSFEVVDDLLQDDALVSAKEDHVLQFVCDFSKRLGSFGINLHTLLNRVRLPRLTLSAFERAAVSLPGFKDSKGFEAIVRGMEFLDLIGEEQLRPRRRSNVHLTMLWIGEHHEEDQNGFSIAHSLVIPFEGTAKPPQQLRQLATDRVYLTGVNSFSTTPFFSAANHLFGISILGHIEKLTFKKRGTYRWEKSRDSCLQDNLMAIEQVIGVDTEEDSFYMSCLRRTNGAERVFVLKCQLIQKDDLKTEKVEIPPGVMSIKARRMIYKRAYIVILDENNQLLVYNDRRDSLYLVPNPDEWTPKYVEIAVQDDHLYVFDYSMCPVDSHDFSQPFSRFDKIRVFNLVSLSWVSQCQLSLNSIRNSGHNELIDFNVDMYFIRSQLYFSWIYQGWMYLFRADANVQKVDLVYKCKIPREANAVILLPGFYTSHDETTVLEKCVNSYCQKHLSVVGESRLAARKVAKWRERFLDEVHTSGLLQQCVAGVAWGRP